MITVKQYNSENKLERWEGHHCIAWVNSGEGILRVGSDDYELSQSNIITISQDQQFSFSPSTSIEGYAVWFEDSDYPQSSIDSVCRIVLLYKKFNIHNQVIVPEAFSNEFEQLFQLMYQEGKMAGGQVLNPILSLLLQTLLLKMEQIIRQSLPAKKEKDTVEEQLLMQFLSLLEQHYSSKHKVKEYADLMHQSSRKLNDLVKEYFGITAKDLISNKLYVEIARQLQFSSMAVKEIAYQSGFKTPYHLSHFFTKIKGISPQAYREMLKK